MNINDVDLQFITWLIMDGTMVDERKYNPKSTKRRLQFKLSKIRKINSLKFFLEKNNIKYTFKVCKKVKTNKLQPYYIRIYGNYARHIHDYILECKKTYPEWIKNINQKQFNLLLNILSITDGTIRKNHIDWITTSDNDFNVVKFLCNKHNIKCVSKYLGTNKSGFKKNAKPQYQLRIYNNV